MRAVVCRVTEAEVEVDGEVTARLDRPGLLVLLGVDVDDGDDDVSTMVRKLAELRVLRGEVGAVDAGAPVMVVSQFTLMGSTARGRRPSWARAAGAVHAEPLVAAVVAGLRARGLTVSTGVFGAEMRVRSVNDGPFTVLVETHSDRDL